MATYEDVARLVREFPEVTEGDQYGRHGQRSWKVAGKAFAWERPFSKADVRRFGAAQPPSGPILAVRVADLAEKEAVLATTSEAIFTIAHFQGYPAVLIQLDTVPDHELREAIVDAWLSCAPASLAQAFVERQGKVP